MVDDRLKEDAHLMLSSYEHRTSEEMMRALEMFLQIYADPGNWLEDPRREPHHFHFFAEEALAALARFRGRRAIASEVSEIVWRLDVDAAPPGVWLLGWIDARGAGDFTVPVQVTAGTRTWFYREDKRPFPTSLTVVKWAYDPAATKVAEADASVTARACGPSTVTCRCECPGGPCEHVWDGERVTLAGRDGTVCTSRTCSRCGTSAMNHDLWIGP